MSCKTSDERREVAARLRDAAELPEENILAVLVDICGINFNFGGNVTLWRSTMTRLADLIDPTCTVVSESVHTGGFGCEEAGYEFTLSCGHTVIVDGEFPPSYCDECGARVVSDDE